MGVQEEHVTRTDQETGDLAAGLAARLHPGDWVLLHGSLGAGKTAFVRGLARGMGIDPRLVHSPTYTLVTEYSGQIPLAHVDLYRIESGRELEELGLEDLESREVIVAVEWGERLPPWAAPGAWHVEIEALSTEERRIQISRAG
jgi:tRNA threonylcarbamoyladenosine biosynthesis protein TsaE